MKAGLTEARQYLNSMRNAIGDHLINPNSIYYGKEGNLRLARECGYALNDFNTEGQQEILHSSYGSIYVIGCNLKPILDAKEWITEMSKQIKQIA
jgi:hypothetical protein